MQHSHMWPVNPLPGRRRTSASTHLSPLRTCTEMVPGAMERLAKAAVRRRAIAASVRSLGRSRYVAACARHLRVAHERLA